MNNLVCLFNCLSVYAVNFFALGVMKTLGKKWKQKIDDDDVKSDNSFSYRYRVIHFRGRL